MRALYKSYDGYLYQISRASDLQTINIGVTSRGGYADSAAQDKFCAATTCVIATIFDQSPQRNDLVVEAGDHGASATALPVWVGGHKVYGLKVTPGVGYRHTHAAGVATNGQPESMYMVAGGPVNSGCCFDYGNTENTQTDTGAGHMDALNYSAGAGGLWYTGGGPGPWVMADMENGVFAGPNHSGTVPFNPKNTGNASPVVTGLLKNDGQKNWALKGGNAASGNLTTWYDGPLPSGWAPMHQEGSIVLGTGGDNSHADIGSFYEGVMTAALTSDASDNAVQANIVSNYQETGRGNVSVGADGTVIGVTPDGRVFRYTGTDPQARTEIPGKLLTRAAVQSANDIWGRAPDGTIWRYTGGGWAQIAGNGIDIAAGSDGTVWRTDATGTYKWTGQTSTTDPAVNWALVPGSSLNGIARLVERAANQQPTCGASPMEPSSGTMTAPAGPKSPVA